MHLIELQFRLKFWFCSYLCSALEMVAMRSMRITAYLNSRHLGSCDREWARAPSRPPHSTQFLDHSFFLGRISCCKWMVILEVNLFASSNSGHFMQSLALHLRPNSAANIKCRPHGQRWQIFKCCFCTVYSLVLFKCRFYAHFWW